MTDGPAFDTAPQAIAAVGPPPPIATQGLGLALPLRAHLCHQPPRRSRGPAGQGGEREPTPPGLIGEAQHPLWMPGCQADEPVAWRFLNAYGGSGLVLQRVARRQLLPNRLRAWRMVSMLSW